MSEQQEKRVKENVDADGETPGVHAAGHPGSPVDAVAPPLAASSSPPQPDSGSWVDVVSRLSIDTNVTPDTPVPPEERADLMNRILAQVREQADGHLVRIELGPTYWTNGDLPEKVDVQINPFPDIYKDWIDGHPTRQRVFDLWLSLPRGQRPPEGFFFWLQSTISLLATHTSPEPFSMNGLLRESSKHCATAVLEKENLFRYIHLGRDALNFLDDKVHDSMAKQLQCAWAATYFQAFHALASRLVAVADPKQKRGCWWLDEQKEIICNRYQCTTTPVPYVWIPENAFYNFV